ncbi:hypothetical protein JDU35_19045 [Escherichia coli]|nr:hypothetical protein [Escherichia coli]
MLELIDKSNITDGIVFKDNENQGEVIVFNFFTWVEIIKAIMMKYAGKNEQESDNLFFSSVLFKNLKIESYNDVTFYSHEVEYHWAMLIAYGELYWEKGISSQEPEGYFEWEAQYRKNHNLAEESFEFNY